MVQVFGDGKEVCVLNKGKRVLLGGERVCVLNRRSLSLE